MTVSRAKIAARHLLQVGTLRTQQLADRMFPPAPPASPERDRQLKKTAETLRAMAALGLVERNTPAPGFCRALDREGLRRVTRVGLAQYAREQRQPAG